MLFTRNFHVHHFAKEQIEPVGDHQIVTSCLIKSFLK